MKRVETKERREEENVMVFDVLHRTCEQQHPQRLHVLHSVPCIKNRMIVTVW